MGKVARGILNAHVVIYRKFVQPDMDRHLRLVA